MRNEREYLLSRLQNYWENFEAHRRYKAASSEWITEVMLYYNTASNEFLKAELDALTASTKVHNEV